MMLFVTQRLGSKSQPSGFKMSTFPGEGKLCRPCLCPIAGSPNPLIARGKGAFVFLESRESPVRAAFSRQLARSCLHGPTAKKESAVRL